jgi:hypothetical protein
MLSKYSKLAASVIGTILVVLSTFFDISPNIDEATITIIASLIGNALVWAFPANSTDTA